MSTAVLASPTNMVLIFSVYTARWPHSVNACELWLCKQCGCCARPILTFVFSSFSPLNRVWRKQEWDKDEAQTFFFMRMPAIHCYSFCEARNVTVYEPYKITLITETDFFETVKRQRHRQVQNVPPNFFMWGIVVNQPVVKLHKRN